MPQPALPAMRPALEVVRRGFRFMTVWSVPTPCSPDLYRCRLHLRPDVCTEVRGRRLVLRRDERSTDPILRELPGSHADGINQSDIVTD